MQVWIWKDTQVDRLLNVGRKRIIAADNRETIQHLFAMDVLEFAHLLAEEHPPEIVAQILTGLNDCAGERFPAVLNIKPGFKVETKTPKASEENAPDKNKKEG